MSSGKQQQGTVPSNHDNARSRKRGRRRRPHHDGASDLFVPLPTTTDSSSSSGRNILVKQLSQRLQEAGYQQVAFTHTVYGKPKDPIDRVDHALSEDCLRLSSRNDHQSSSNNHRQSTTGLKVFRRLHAVLENLSDVASYTNQSATEEARSILEEYDLVSIAPRNEAVFRAVMESALACDMITLDYTVQRSGLPFRVRTADMRAIIERQIALEIPYAAALLQPSWRKSWIQVAVQVQQASRGQTPTILWSSSGDRKTEHVNDTTTLALRRPRDVQNLATTVLGFDRRRPTTRAAHLVLARAQRRRHGTDLIANIEMGTPTSSTTTTETTRQPKRKLIISSNDSDRVKKSTKKSAKSKSAAKTVISTEENKDEDDTGDGFISF